MLRFRAWRNYLSWEEESVEGSGAKGDGRVEFKVHAICRSLQGLKAEARVE